MSTCRVALPLITPEGVSEIHWSSPATTADLLMQSGALIVTAASDGSPVQRFHHATWLRCTVYDDDGHVRYTVFNAYYGAAAQPSAA